MEVLTSDGTCEPRAGGTSLPRGSYMVMLRYRYADYDDQTYSWEGIILDATLEEAIAEARRHARITATPREQSDGEDEATITLELSSESCEDVLASTDLYYMNSETAVEEAIELRAALAANVFVRGMNEAIPPSHPAFKHAANLIAATASG